MFVIKCALKKLIYSRKICLIFVLSIAAGLLCPVYVLGYIHTSAKMEEMHRFSSPEDYLLVNGSMPFMDQAALENMKYIVGGTLDDYECAYQTTVSWGDVNGVAFIGGVSAGILSRVPVYVKEGRLFDENDYGDEQGSVCILADNSALYLAGARVGDEIFFMGNTYEVIGVIDGWGSNLIGAILIPYPQMYYVSGNSSIQHRFIIPKGDEGLEASIMAKTQSMFDVNIYSVTSMVEEEKAANEIIDQQNQKWLLIGFVVCFFAFLSISAISAGRSLEERKFMGLHKAIGATQSQLFFEALMQNIILVMAALIVDGAILCLPWEKVMGMEVQYSILCIVQIIAIGMILALILTLFSVHGCKKPVSRLIERRG